VIAQPLQMPINQRGRVKHACIIARYQNAYPYI